MELFLSSSQPVVGVWRAVLIVSKELERAIFCRIFYFCGLKCPPPPRPCCLQSLLPPVGMVAGSRMYRRPATKRQGERDEKKDRRFERIN